MSGYSVTEGNGETPEYLIDDDDVRVKLCGLREYFPGGEDDSKRLAGVLVVQQRQAVTRGQCGGWHCLNNCFQQSQLHLENWNESDQSRKR